LPSISDKLFCIVGFTFEKLFQSAAEMKNELGFEGEVKSFSI